MRSQRTAGPPALQLSNFRLFNFRLSTLDFQLLKNPAHIPTAKMTVRAPNRIGQLPTYTLAGVRRSSALAIHAQPLPNSKHTSHGGKYKPSMATSCIGVHVPTIRG